MKNLFIDSNVLLSLYHFTNDDLAQFGKLKESFSRQGTTKCLAMCMVGKVFSRQLKFLVTEKHNAY